MRKELPRVVYANPDLQVRVDPLAGDTPAGLQVHFRTPGMSALLTRRKHAASDYHFRREVACVWGAAAQTLTSAPEIMHELHTMGQFSR